MHNSAGLPTPISAGPTRRAGESRRITVSRLVGAPRRLVFRMWTDPMHLARWWGPHGFTNPVCEADPRPGGALRIVMRSPDGTDYALTGSFQEIAEPERLILSAVAQDGAGDPLLKARITVSFADHYGQTRVTVQASAAALAAEAAPMLDGMEAGWTQSLKRLAGIADGGV